MESNGWRRANVLAVDDQRANLVALDAVLCAECNLIFAGSGEEAISILESRQDIDVILMDAQMPGMDGFEATARIKQMEGCRDIPVIFITAVYNEDPFVKQGYQVGAVDYFSKPFDPQILRTKVGIYASFRQRADMLRERERQIRHSEELLRAGRRLAAMLERLQVGVIVTDAQGAIRHANHEGLALWKDCAPGPAGGEETILGWWRSDGRLIQDVPAALARALAGEAAPEVCVEVRRPDGSSRSLLCGCSPLRGLDGRLVGAAVIVHDVTERRKMESDLEARIECLVRGTELQAG